VARFSDKIKSSDISVWGLVALVCGAIAVFSANMPSIIPANFATNMHATRLDGSSLNNMREQVAALKKDSARIREEYNRLTTMLKIAEQGRNEVTKRVGAMESSLPLLLEAIPPGVKVDTLITTASIGENGENDKKIETDGGYVITSSSAIDGENTTQATQVIVEDLQVTAPPALEEITIATNSAFGIALGSEIKAVDAIVAWQDIERKVGPLLLGLEPILSKDLGNGERKMIAGPIEDYSIAEQLCTRMLRVGIACLPIPYEGIEMPE